MGATGVRLGLHCSGYLSPSLRVSPIVGLWCVEVSIVVQDFFVF